MSAKRNAVTYSGLRHYTLDNPRFGKHASVTVRLTSRLGEAKQFTIVNRSGSERLIGIIEHLLKAEADSSRPGKTGDHEISPSNYTARLRGFDTISGHSCLVLDLTPKARSKYLLKGTAWVDKATNALVRLDGTTADSISFWVGSPRVVEDFAPVDGIWLLAHTKSTSSSMLLGESSLEIRYTDYQVTGKAR
jgi:hypothetical protein